eukprot:jgi/Botrbrau1/8895/Bobra.0148s0014.3
MRAEGVSHLPPCRSQGNFEAREALLGAVGESTNAGARLPRHQLAPGPRKPHTRLTRLKPYAGARSTTNWTACCAAGTEPTNVPSSHIPPLVYVGTLSQVNVKEEWLDSDRKKQRREGVPLVDPSCGVHGMAMGSNTLLGRTAKRHCHILPYAGAMEGDFRKHAVPVKRIESILGVQAENDEDREILLVCHQAVEGMVEAFCTPSGADPTPSWCGSKYSQIVGKTAATANLETRRRRVSPTAMGRIPPSGFERGVMGALAQ